MTKIDLADFLERLKAHDPDHDKGKPLRFADIAKAFPGPQISDEKRYPRVRMADFAEIGYCAYKGWHRGRGTEIRRPPVVEAKAINGEKIHVRKVVEELRAARKLPVATSAHLRNPEIDIARIPELPAWIKVGRLVYASKIERAGRTAGDLVVTEIKTGNWVLMADHFLQAWGYCLSAPSALLRVTEGNFRAKAVRWSLSYPKETFGPYPFTEKTLRLAREGMRHFERLYRAGLASDMQVPIDPYGPSPRKCPPCAFSHACAWNRTQERDPRRDEVTIAGVPKRPESVLGLGGPRIELVDGPSRIVESNPGELEIERNEIAVRNYNLSFPYDFSRRDFP